MGEKLIRNEQDAIETIKSNMPTSGYEMLKESLNMAISALEKQIPKTPDYQGDGYADGVTVIDTWICPCCGEHYEVDCDDYDFCPKCGQAINRESCQRYTVEDALEKWGMDVKEQIGKEKGNDKF